MENLNGWEISRGDLKKIKNYICEVKCDSCCVYFNIRFEVIGKNDPLWDLRDKLNSIGWRARNDDALCPECVGDSTLG